MKFQFGINTTLWVLHFYNDVKIHAPLLDISAEATNINHLSTDTNNIKKDYPPIFNTTFLFYKSQKKTNSLFQI